MQLQQLMRAAPVYEKLNRGGENPMEHSEYGTMVVILKIALRKQVELS
jgi:hypothetical protein